MNWKGLIESALWTMLQTLLVCHSHLPKRLIPLPLLKILTYSFVRKQGYVHAVHIIWPAKSLRDIILNGALKLEMIRGSMESFYWFPSFFSLVSHRNIKVSCVWSLSLIKPRCPPMSAHFIVAAFWEMVPPRPHVPVGCVRIVEGDGHVGSSHTSPPREEGDGGKEHLAVGEAALSPAWWSLYGLSRAPGGPRWPLVAHGPPRFRINAVRVLKCENGPAEQVQVQMLEWY